MGKQLNDNMPRVFDTNDGEFFIIDEQHNAIAEFSSGHIKTQHFNSAAANASIQSLQQSISGIGGEAGVNVAEDDDAPFDVCDPSGNVVLRVGNDGHIKTKNFDSAAIDIFRQTKLDQPQCICHGYGAATGQANTIPYFRNGVSKGYKFFECDAVNCSDGVPVCTHAYDSYSVKNRTSGTTETIQLSEISSTDLLAGYTWADGTEIATLNEVIWFICYFHRYPLHVDGQGMTKASRYAASQYAESLGVGQFVFHELQGGAYTDWDIPCNAIVGGGSVSAIQSAAASYKKADNNIIFYVAKGVTASTAKTLADAAHAAGCYLMTFTYGSSEIDTMRSLFKAGMDFIITSGTTNSSI